ncbi:hypothetical protein FA13DRAFT_1787223 [Coprinellus micaceus]|uniref:CHAT domain-containing protein n=1 Tax=Coprinellus micaceus TaxID=71717 RepID=A0A4Y7TRX8_COPMI|nr:hypothetical protein FA13DRAFT_1787223 [Coprinellus micaceus]
MKHASAVAEQQSSPNSLDNGNKESVIGLKDVAFRDSERRGNSEHNNEITPGELHIFGLGGEYWKTFQVYEASPGEWKTSSPIEFPPGVVGLRCIVGQDGRKDGQIMHLGYSSWKDDTPEGDTVVGKPGRISCAQLRLPMSCKSVEIATPKYPTHLQEQLARCEILTEEFKRTGNLANISEAISIRWRMVEATPEDDANLAEMLNNLAMSFLDRFGHVDRPAAFNNLGNSYQICFERTGHLPNIENAILALTNAVHLTPEGDADLPSRLNNLGSSFLCRFKRLGNLADAAEAISLQTRAASLTPEGHAALPSQLMNLATSFVSLFEVTKDASDLSEAISLQTCAVDLTPALHADLPSWLNNLGISLLMHFWCLGNMSDIAEAIARQNQAVDLAPEGHAHLPTLRTNLGNSYMQCFDQTNNPLDGKDGISNLVQALQHTPEMHAELPPRHMNLAFAWYRYFTSSHRSDHLDTAISNYKSAATCTSGSPRRKLEGAICWAGLLDNFYPCSTSVLTAFRAALDLLTSLAGLEQTVQHRFTMVGKLLSIPGEAAAAALRLERPDKALEWLEQGRCLVWGQQSKLRTPLDALQAHDTALAERIVFISRHLKNAGSSRQHSGTNKSWEGKVSLEHEALKHSQLASEWDLLLTKVRDLPGFEHFLQPLQCSTILRHLPESGPVVVLNTHGDRCDAMVLLAGLYDPLRVKLPDFSLAKARQYRQSIIPEDCEASERAASRYGRKHGAGTGGIYFILHSLWTEVVKPILDMLNLARVDDPSKVPLTRIWWCPTGPLSFLPLHAAGVYEGT